MPRRFWLLKTEPAAFSFDDLLARPGQTAFWDGVRNYQARNFLRDSIHRGDRALFYHSGAGETAVVGTVEVVAGGSPDPTQFDRRSDHFDSGSNPTDPRWFGVHVRAEEKFANPLTLAELRKIPALAKMTLLQKGSRLSVQTVTAAEWKTVIRAGGRRAA